MGLPARERKQRERRPTLRLVRNRPPRRRSSRSLRATRSGRDAFAAFALVCVTLACVGLVRVALSAHAFDALLQADVLQSEIEAEKLEGDMLEVSRSALTTPSRIESIAGATMQMSEAGDVSYLQVAADEVAHGDPSSTAEAAEAPAGLSRLVSAVKALAATEVHALLVGDVGLASSQ